MDTYRFLLAFQVLIFHTCHLFLVFCPVVGAVILIYYMEQMAQTLISSVEFITDLSLFSTRHLVHSSVFPQNYI